eukprot:gnl/TRDRNA2_/TRDRNA2_35357_c0_seq1.p1 gnl/TRDRNA2_/TRDRNA2_35357_c0~~gnl/TRDRNA2_/TRDRNA2_35357_c0_seq1.p1  ORF type:complete len:132 (+),score=31.32 gnl/TRDRNA2_/TRDRNA2_35357_c0_seq1:92-487(+)
MCSVDGESLTMPLAHDDDLMKLPIGKQECGTPTSQMSTAPPTPAMHAIHLDPLEDTSEADEDEAPVHTISMPSLQSELGQWAESVVSCEEALEAYWQPKMPPLQSWLGRWAEAQVLVEVEAGLKDAPHDSE